MSTGYTADIAKGISFKEYAWSCARAFGALVMMRDDPSNAPIPESFPVSDYHPKRIAEVTAELEALSKLTGDELKAAHAAAVHANMESEAQRHREANELRAKYEAMLALAKAFKAPTTEHEEYARFLVKQIEDSIDFDCKVYPRDPITANPDRWRADKVQALAESIEYHRNGHAKEIEGTARRNAWLQNLRTALG